MRETGPNEGRKADEPEELRAVRATLEEAVTPAQTSTILFEALAARDGDAPMTPDDVVALIRGPLRDVLAKRLAPGEVHRLLRKLEDAVAAAGAAGAPEGVEIAIESEPPPPDLVRERDATQAVPTRRAAVPVLIVASGRGFATRLAAALGPGQMVVATASDFEGIARAKAPLPPAIVVVDAASFPPIDPVALTKALQSLPATTVRVVWCADLPYGRQLVAALGSANVPAVALAQQDGIDPLLDLVRSRRSQ